MENKQCQTYSVYVHTFPNGKKYVGITKYDPKHRWANGNGYKTQPVYRAISKYGWENIDHEIVASGLTQEDAEKMEIDLIKKHDSRLPNGYNSETGGSVNFKLSDDAKRKLREAHLGKKLSEETKRKMPESRKGKKGVRLFGKDNPNYGNHKLAGKNNPFYGKKHSEESIEKMRAFQRGRKLSEETKRKMSKSHKGLIDGEKNPMYGALGEKHHAAKRVDQFTKSGEFVKRWGSIADVERELGIAHNSISRCCKGNLKSCGGFVWRYSCGNK